MLCNIWSIFIFIIFTAIFFIVVIYNSNVSRCSPLGGKCFDGNGKYQYKGRGYRKESIDILLSRIDWLAKNSCNDALYTTSYIMAFLITIATFVIIYAFTCHVLSVWEIIIILFSAFIICFSVLNLFNFHTNRYSSYYIRKNIDYITRHLNVSLNDAPDPSHKSKIPFRTKVHDVLTK